MEKEEPPNPAPKVGEPLEQYFQSPSFLKSFKKITISTPEEQEEANRIFSASLTPLQRMEYMTYLNKVFLDEFIKKAPDSYTGKVYFD